ncbi:hypothetical protein D3C87_1578390 [compost metagenome]
MFSSFASSSPVSFCLTVFVVGTLIDLISFDTPDAEYLRMTPRISFIFFLTVFWILPNSVKCSINSLNHFSSISETSISKFLICFLTAHILS